MLLLAILDAHSLSGSGLMGNGESAALRGRPLLSDSRKPRKLVYFTHRTQPRAEAHTKARMRHAWVALTEPGSLLLAQNPT